MPTSRTTSIFFHGDTDGCCCAAMVCDLLQREGTPFELHPLEADFSGDFVGDIFLDLGGVRKANVHPNTIVVDHHPQDKLPCRQFNPRLRGKDWPASYECFLNFGRDEVCWIGAVGCVGDSQPNASLEERVKKRFGKVDLQKASFMIEAYRSKNGTASMGLVVEKLLAYRENPNGFCSDPEFMGVYEEVEKEIKRILASNVERDGKMLVVKFASPYAIKSQLSNIFMKKYPDKVVLMAQQGGGGYRISLRQEVQVVDFSAIMPSLIKGLDASGGGHPKASGAAVSNDDFPEFYRRLKDALRAGR